MIMIRHDQLISDPRMMSLLNIFYSAGNEEIPPVKEFAKWLFRALELIDRNTNWIKDKHACLLNNAYFEVLVKLDNLGDKMYFITIHDQPVNEDLNYLLKMTLGVEKLLSSTFILGEKVDPNYKLACEFYHDVIKVVRNYIGFRD